MCADAQIRHHTQTKTSPSPPHTQVKRGAVALKSGDPYTPGEKLTVSFPTTYGTHFFCVHTNMSMGLLRPVSFVAMQRSDSTPPNLNPKTP